MVTWDQVSRLLQLRIVIQVSELAGLPLSRLVFQSIYTSQVGTSIVDCYSIVFFGLGADTVCHQEYSFWYSLFSVFQSINQSINQSMLVYRTRSESNKLILRKLYCPDLRNSKRYRWYKPAKSLFTAHPTTCYHISALRYNAIRP